MASAKDTFEPDTFEANSFACGTWRGVGVDVVTITGCVVARQVYQGGQKAGETYQSGMKTGQAGCCE